MAIYGRVEMFYEMSCNKIKMFLKIMKKMQKVLAKCLHWGIIRIINFKNDEFEDMENVKGENCYGKRI